MEYNNEDEYDHPQKGKKESMFDMPKFDMDFAIPSFGGDEPSKERKPSKGMGLASDEDIDQLSAIGRNLMGQ